MDNNHKNNNSDAQKSTENSSNSTAQENKNGNVQIPSGTSDRVAVTSVNFLTPQSFTERPNNSRVAHNVYSYLSF